MSDESKCGDGSDVSLTCKWNREGHVNNAIMCIPKTSHKTPHAVGCYGDKQDKGYRKIPPPWC